jgi:hypothetical protein
MDDIKNALIRLIALIGIFTLTAFIAYITMVKAWGLEIKSWPWFITGYVASFIVMGLVSIFK